MLPRKQVFWLMVGLLLLLSSSIVRAYDSAVVPGRRLGTVSLGMNRSMVFALLHRPSRTRYLSRGALFVDTWLGQRLLATGPNGDRSLKRDYLTVFFRRGYVVQIEASAARFATAGGLSTRRSANAFAKRYPDHRMPLFAANPAINWDNFHYNEAAVDPAGSSPAAKHFVLYGDSTAQGIAWKYGAWGDLAPEPDPDGPLEAVIVHTPGEPVLLNPNDGLPYAGTGPARG